MGKQDGMRAMSQEEIAHRQGEAARGIINVSGDYMRGQAAMGSMYRDMVDTTQATKKLSLRQRIGKWLHKVLDKR